MTDKKKTVKCSKETALVQWSDEDSRLLTGLREKLVNRVEFKNRKPTTDEGSPESMAFALLMDTCKVIGANSALQIVSNAAAGQFYRDDSDANLTIAFALLKDLAPQTPLEAMLVSQMIAVNTAIGKTMRRGMQPDQSFAAKEMNLNLATKLQRTFIQQVETLQKLRGKGQQTVRVEHVTVNAGGQAIVGNVEHRGGG